MTRTTAFALAALALLSAPAEAQRVTGLEMSIEGSLTAVDRQEQLLLVTLHAVSGADELRPAANAELKVTASYRADGPIATLRTDRHGRAEIRYTPEDVGNLEIVIDAFHAGASRRFRVPVDIATQGSFHVEVLPTRAEPGSQVLVFGYATDTSDQPVGAGREVRIVAPGREPVVVRTTADGAFIARVQAPTELGRATVRATLEAVQGTETEPGQPATGGQVEVEVAEATVHRGLRARGVPRQPIVRPRGPIVVDVEVRDGLGRPVRASVSRQGTNEDPVRADEHGVATFEWTAPSITGIHDEVASFRVQLPGEAPIDERVTIRVASVPAAADVAPEAGALIPGVPSRLLVKAVRADGSPYAGPVTLSAPRFGNATLTTDALGYGAAEVTLAEEATTDACGGVTAVAVQVAFGDASGEARCVPIDPDAAVRTRVESTDGDLRVRLHRRGAVGRAPAVITVFRMLGDNLVPVASRWVDGGDDSVTLDRPAPGPLWVRARVRVGRNEAEVRGSFAFAPGVAAPSVRLQGGVASSSETSAVGSILSSAASVEAYQRRHAAPDALTMARAVPRDIGAPFRLVRGEPTPAAPLEEPVEVAVLRDPWRQRALYRSGRLALLFRTLENQVAEATAQERSSLDDITHEVRGRRQFNEGFLESVDRMGELGPEGARDLGGEPLTLARLRGMDRAFGFDTVARRVTRKRLIELLAAWRPWVHDRDLDPAFAPHADPRHWWATFCNEHEWTFDGWGRPFRLQPTRQQQDGVPVVVPGWAITSAGPDGRFDTNDDLDDPFASVVPAGLYSDAVGEAGLVQALRRGVLDRETIRMLDAGPMARLEGRAIRGGLPQPLVVEPPPFLAGELHVETRLGDEPLDTRLPPATVPHRLLGIAVGAGGVGLTSEPVSSRAGARVALPVPARLHEGVPLAMPVVIVAGERTEGLTLTVQGEGADVSVGSAELGALDAGDAVERTLRIEATDAGTAATVTLSLQRGGETVVERVVRAPVVDGTPERTLWAGSATDGVWRVRYPVPDDARAPTTRLVVVAPGRVDADPRLAFGPTARAWARLMAGEGEAVHLSDLPTDASDAVDAARLALLTTALGEERRQHHAAERRLARELRSLDTAGRSRVLAVLSSMALPRFAPASGNGPAAVAQRLREELWTAHETEGSALARMAAALLLTDPEDPNGRAAYVRARRLMEPAGDSGDAQVVPATDPRDQLAASVALALAAHAAQDTRTRDRLVRGLGRRTHLAADRQSDAAFWLLTAAAHGTFGRSEGDATLRIDGRSEALTFEDGVAVADVEGEAEIALELETSGGVHLSRLETRYGRPVAESDESPLRVAVEGIDGRAGRRAGYEIRVSATTAVEHPVLAITLPPGADLEPSALAAIGASEGVSATAEPDARGVLRIELSALAAEQERRFPLPLRWAGAGEREGLAIAAWERARPWEVTSIPARAIDVRP